MRQCPDTDTIVTIGSALHWHVADGLRHLQSCSECREQIELLAATHTAFTAEAPVADATLARIEAAIVAERGNEHAAARTTQRRVSMAETVLAAIAAPVALVSGGVRVDSPAVLGIAAVMGAVLLVIGWRLRLHA
jgi:predicted anti-sigma-YlaC factor YlaD